MQICPNLWNISQIRNPCPLGNRWSAFRGWKTALFPDYQSIPQPKTGMSYSVGFQTEVLQQSERLSHSFLPTSIESHLSASKMPHLYYGFFMIWFCRLV